MSQDAICGLPVHPAARLFPMMDADGLRELAADIERSGLREPIRIYLRQTEEGDYEFVILDGRNRAAALEILGRKVPDHTENLGALSQAEAVAYVLSANIHRRHLTPSQLAMLAARLQPMYEEARRKSGQICPNEPRPRDAAAAAVGVSGRSVQDALLVLEDEALAAQVDAGEVSVSRAAKQLREERAPAPPSAPPSAPSLSTSSSGADPSPSAPEDAGQSDECYSPRHIIEAARLVLGRIDLDPASCAEANEVVGAASYYTAEDDGLVRAWPGRVWVNPPYSDTSAWVGKLLDEYAAGAEGGGCEEAILLVHAQVGAGWFWRLHGHPVCYLRGRLRHWGPGGGPSPRHYSVVVYLGERPERFAEVFGYLGRVVAPASPAQLERAASTNSLSAIPDEVFARLGGESR